MRHLYGLPPDNARTRYNGFRSRWSIHDVYGMYYSFLAGQMTTSPLAATTPTLFDYVESVGMSIGGRITGRLPDEVSMLARLPATEYLRGGHCAHADRAVVVINGMTPPPNDAKKQ